MKITSLTGSLAYTPVNREKQDGNAFYDQNSQQKQPNQEEPQKQESESVEASPGLIDEAVEGFQTDTQAQASGLRATVEGDGPGLKVVLKDGSGSVVRQFTGEEFLRLRQAASKDGRIRGKILDQKL